MIKNALVLILSCYILTGCNNSTTHSTSQPQKHETDYSPKLSSLGTLAQCQKYSGLPSDWGQNKYSGMIKIPAGDFNLGSELAYQDEQNFGVKKKHVSSFWIDQTEVTVAEFQTFVDATKYKTDAEQQKEAAVFSPQQLSHQSNPQKWWVLKTGYSWKMPHGDGGTPANPSEPVRYVTLNDAEHYAAWKGREIPTEIEWEYAAKAGQQKDLDMHHQPRDQHHHPQANYWQGKFPFENKDEDGFEDVAPVGCFQANSFGLHDMIGNVWEWTASPYQGAHDMHLGNPSALRQNDHTIQTREYVIKGGSFLCADNYCARFRNSARYPQEVDLAITHVGFRTIIRNLNAE